MTENEIPLHRMTRVVPELQPNTRYSLRVRTVSRFNVPSNWSEAIDFTTPGTNYQPPLPRPLLYEGNTSTEVTSGESALAEFIDGDLKAWPKANIVTTDNIHFSAPFYAPGSLRLDWQWFDDVGSATIELREKESLTIVDKWELPTTPSGGTTFPMHYSSAYEWRLNLGGPAGATGPTNDDARIAVGDRGIYEQVPTNEIVFGRLYDEVDPTFRYETWDPRIASLGNNKFVSIGVMDEDADPSRGLVVEEWTRDGNSVTKDRRTLLTGGGTNETGLGNVAGVHAFDDKFVLWVGKGYSEASFGGDFGIMATLIELTDAGAVVRDRVTVDIWSFSATNYDYALTSGITPSDGALLAYMKQTNNGWDIAIHTVRIGRSGNSLTLSHINVPLEQTDYPGNPAIAPISDTSYMVTYTTLDQAPPTSDGPRLRGFVIDETLATPGVSVGPTMITALPHHLALSQDGLAYINRLARHVGGESFTAVYPTSERSGTTGRQYALNVITIDANLGLIRTEDVGWPSAGGSTQSHAGVWHVPGYDHVVAIALDAQNTSWRLLEIKDTGIIQLDESMLETTSHDPSYWNIDFVPFDTVGVVALSTSIAGLEWNDRPFILEFPAIPITSIFSARVRLQGSETALWDLVFALPEPEEDFECPDLEHTDWLIKKSATSPPEYYVSGGGFGPTSTSSAPAPDQPSPTALPRGGPLTSAGQHQWYAPAHHQWGSGTGQDERWLLDFGNGSYEWLYYVGRHPKTGGGNPHLYNHPWNTWGDDCIVRNQFTVQDGVATYSPPSIVAGSSPWEKFETQYVFPGRAMLDRNNHSRDHGVSVGPTLRDAERPVHYGGLEPYVKARTTDEYRDVPRWRFNEDIGASGPGEPFISIDEETFGQYNLRTEWTTACNISDGWSAYISLFRSDQSENSRIFLRAVSPNSFPGLNDPATLEINTTKYHPDFRAASLDSAIYKIKDGTIFLVLEDWIWDDNLNAGGDVLIYVQFDWTGTEWIEVGHKQVTNVESEFSWETLATQNIDGVLYMTFQNYGFYNGDWFPTDMIARMPLIGEEEPSYIITMRESWGGEAQRLVWVDDFSLNLATYNLADDTDVHPGITILPIGLNPDGSMFVKEDQQQWVIEIEQFKGWSDVYMLSFARSFIIFGRLDSPEIGVQNDEFAWQVVCCGTEEESQVSDPFIAELQTQEGDEFRMWTDSNHPPIIPPQKIGDYLIINKHIDASPNASSQIDGGPYTRGTRYYIHNSNSFVMKDLGIRTISIKLPEDFKKMS